MFKPYTQNNIPYFYVCNDDNVKKEYQRFVYRWRQAETNMQGITYIYCKSLEDLQKLIDYWNQKEYKNYHWEYSIVEEQQELESAA